MASALMPPPRTIPFKTVCYLCNKPATTGDNGRTASPWMFGPIMEHGGIKVHYFCVLFMEGLYTTVKDTKEICGFTVKNIKEKKQLFKERVCFFCREGYASIKCKIEGCNTFMHFKCAAYMRCVAEFQRGYLMSCLQHSQEKMDRYFSYKQIDAELYPIPDFKPGDECKLCFEKLDKHDKKIFESLNYFYMPCCYFGLIHRKCLREFAYNAGNYIRCPNVECDVDNVAFLKYILQAHGVYCPDRMAEWEVNDGNYKDLETSYVDTTYDQLVSQPGDLGLTFEQTKCDYPRCIDSVRGTKKNHITTCIECKESFAHYKCHIYFTGTKIKAKRNQTPNLSNVPKFMCTTCKAKTNLSLI